MTNNPAARIDAIARLSGGLIVSCQAPVGSPLRDPAITARIAQAALLGGAVGLRINGPDDVEAVRRTTDRPIIGLFKVPGPARNLITPDLPSASLLVAAGADIIAVDATEEARGRDLGIIASIASALAVPVMADVSTLEEGLRAHEAGADVVGTTLSGYTPSTQPHAETPDLDLVAALAARGVPVVAEGRYRSPAQVADAFAAGAFAVVVGAAITDPLTTTALFTRATPGRPG